ncbi:putative DnaJ-like protein subfamily A member 5 [Triangularia verruculosa]|uniref:DnaJ-like protein subfamily A member 5 n=1 Tax=Triangularia verruculosa TaxID=2587418 RepID=A0AAN6X6N9_9PEZI|nr:putative DnaJ-like protein subfamily A member 5 [Triangularia verruculosa]
MGADQSTPRGAGQAATAVEQKTCYYEVLGVDQQAPDEEIRRAYKKKALELHPDRNYHDTENATRKFAELQTAYEIISDPQERAWYDSHRDAILRGEDDAAGGAPGGQAPSDHTSANAVFALMSRFNSSVPMDDTPRGFFGILNVFFDQLAAEESAACEWDGIPPTVYPPFGRAEDDYNTVGKSFYNVWSSFSTKKSFQWRDVHHLAQAPDRRIRRLMEKENKKLRDEGIREFNDAVLSLVAFVKKRDPRYVPNTQSEAERQQVLRNSAAAQAARSRAAHQEKMAEYTVPDWAQPTERQDYEGEFSMSEEESEVEEIECVVCNKTFRSEKQFEAHEKSKKHIKAVQHLKRQMRKENISFDLDPQDSPDASMPQSPRPRSPGEEAGTANTEPLAPKDRNKEDEKVSSKDQGEEQNQEDREDRDQATQSSSGPEDDEYAPRSAVEERIMNGAGAGKKAAQSPPEESVDLLDSASASVADLTLNEQAPGKKVGKAKLKREKRAAREAEAQNQDSLQCAVCKEAFPSKNKLFDHIKQLDHAAPVPVSKSGKQKKKR